MAKPIPLEDIYQPAPVQEPDCVSVPRDLVGAACAAIEGKRDAPKTLEQLRRYTTGYLSAPPAAQPADHFAGGGKPTQATRQCHWRQSDDESPDTWEGTCGALWTFTDGGPKHNGQAYCPQCGGVCLEVRAEQKGGES